VEKAAAAVATAQAAATRAKSSARSAIRSAAWAVTSYENATQSAIAANAAAQRAVDQAKAAGEEAKEAAAAGLAAFNAYEQAQGLEIGKCHAQYATGAASDVEKLLTGSVGNFYETCVRNVIGNPEELARRAYTNSAYCGILPEGSQPYQACIASVLDPDFRGGQTLLIINEIIKAAMGALIPIALVTAIGCVATVVCVSVVGTLLTLGDVGLSIYQYINGDKTLSDTLLHLGALALESLLFAGVAKLVSAGFRTVKGIYELSRAARRAEAELDLLGLASARLRRLATCLTGNSFTADTRVLLADGSTKPIVDINAGDLVLATDPDTGATAARPVTRLIVNADTELTDVVVKQPSGQQAVVRTTPHHPFWTPATHRWTDAERLRPGTALLTPTGARAGVTATRTYPGLRAMYNLTVADTHTYYVLAGDTAVLVHNESCTNLAIGLNRPEWGMGSDDLAALLRNNGVDARTYNGSPWDQLDPDTNNTLPRWMILVGAAIRDPSVQIHVTLDGLNGATALLRFRDAARLGIRMKPEEAMLRDGTNWELGKLASVLAGERRSLDSVHFYENGVDISASIRAQLPKTDDEWKEFLQL
jgi:hypothetical protein